MESSCQLCGHHHAPLAPCGGATDPRIGEVLGGRYLILRRLAVGGMGSVYEARHVIIQRSFAIKVLHPEYANRPRIVQRFEQEAKAVGALASEHIVAVLDFGDAGGLPYFVMELLKGQDLRQLLAKTPRLPVPRAASIALDVCRGLRSAHGAGLIHRDLKPANIFLTRTSEGREMAKVLDFGVAKLRDVHATTGEGTLIGTVGYMAPEQAISGKNVDQRTDVYSLGIVLYEALAGAFAFEGERADVLYGIVHEGPPALQRENLPSVLIEIVARATARDPAMRYPDVGAFAEALSPFAGVVGTLRWDVDQPWSPVTRVDLEDSAREAHSDVSGAALAPRAEATALARRWLAGLIVGGMIAAVAVSLVARRQHAVAKDTEPRRATSILQSAALPSRVSTEGAKDSSSCPSPLVENLAAVDSPAAARTAEGRTPEAIRSTPHRGQAHTPTQLAPDWPAPSAQFDSKNPYVSPKP